MSSQRTLIAIVGRPNVGKSRLFNRLSDDGEAIVHDTEGVTRDRQYADGTFDGFDYTVVDTGGLVGLDDSGKLPERVEQQVEMAIEQADIILVVTDGRAGCLPGDEEISDLLRPLEKPVVTAVNKVDDVKYRHTMTSPFFQLGLDPIPISAEHGHGLEELFEALKEGAPTTEVVDEPQRNEISVAIVGKPNTGKSTLVNQMIGQPRLLTSEIPGTTRDSIHLGIETEDVSMRLIDTAGLRKKSKVDDELESFAVMQAISSLERADVAVLMIDALEGITNQVKKISDVIDSRDTAVILAINKWDIVEKDTDTAGRFARYLRAEMPYLDFAPIVFISALTGQRIPRLLETIQDVYGAYTRRIQTSKLNEFLESCTANHSPPVFEQKQVKIYYGSQVSVGPPTFLLYANYPQGISDSYKKYIENQLRQNYGFEGTPLRIVFKER